jgi:flagella basal body P-ring formation protein FlgA
LAPGQLISQSDINAVSVLLPQSAKNYLSAKAEIVGALVLTHISTGDLIPTSSITSTSQALDQRFVPLTLELTDLPVDLIRGEIVDIYAIPNRDSKTITSPQLVAENISVSSVNERNNSGKVSVLVILNSDLVMPTLAMLSDSRLIIVRSI